MLHYAMITKQATSVVSLSGGGGTLSVENERPEKARELLITKARSEMRFAATAGERHRFRVELLGETLATGNDRAEVMRKAVATVSRMIIAAQTERPLKVSTAG